MAEPPFVDTFFVVPPVDLSCERLCLCFGGLPSSRIRPREIDEIEALELAAPAALPLVKFAEQPMVGVIE